MKDEKQKPLQEWQRDLVANEPKGFMQDIIQASRQRSQSASLLPDRLRSEDKPRAPSGGTVPIESPPGLQYVDRLCEAAARNDRLAALKVKVETDWLFQLEQTKGPRIESEFNPFDRENMRK